MKPFSFSLQKVRDFEEQMLDKEVVRLEQRKEILRDAENRHGAVQHFLQEKQDDLHRRSEERRVGKEC